MLKPNNIRDKYLQLLNLSIVNNINKLYITSELAKSKTKPSDAMKCQTNGINAAFS